ncbi:MAG TPA: dihydrolipoyl dehydrogenase [Planctomycetaceae bacterium]|nr:dihydrolipoyl dehydrogenase [Planctomycetaceae bacterium]HQZ69178.1 dihydrolipoyl dehydrogenase [Planctomycetaceae bacterium]
MSESFDLIVVGAGPGGYVAAIRASQLGMKVAIVEREKQLGGTCLRVGCIPSKALLETSELYEQSQKHFAERGLIVKGVSLDIAQMMKHKQTVVNTLDGGIQGLLKKNKIERYVGHARLMGKGLVEVIDDAPITIRGKKILIATGSVSSSLPGIEPDGDRIGTSTEAIAWPEVPKHLVVIGAGVIGLELGTVWRRLGSQVTVLEYLPRILPGVDEQVANEAKRIFEKQGLTFKLGTKVTSVTAAGTTCTITMEGAEPITCDRVLIAVGRKPCTDNLGLEEAGVQTDKRGFIQVNGSYQTTSLGVYAIGDVIGGAMLAHKAEEEGIACIEKMMTGHGHINYGTIPAVIYTQPEIASTGANEDALKAAGIKYRAGKFSFAANGRARAAGHTDGFVKVLADEATDRVLGVHIIGAHAGELIHEAVVAMEFGASSEDIARCCHAHPTLSEAVKEAAMAVDKRAIHS